MKVDAKQLRKMREIGFSQKAISVRIGCSIKTVRRHTKGINPAVVIDGFLGTEFERLLWLRYLSVVKTFSGVAFAFGVSRQAVEKFHKQVKRGEV